MKQKPWRKVLYLFASRIPWTQDQAPQGNTARSGLPHQLIIKETPPQTCPQDNLMEAVPQLGFFLSGVSL